MSTVLLCVAAFLFGAGFALLYVRRQLPKVEKWEQKDREVKMLEP